jgi:hypothetical protein
MSLPMTTKSRPPTVNSPRAFERRSVTCSGAAAQGSLLMLLLCLIGTPAARADDSPDAAMMAPITSLANFMAHVDGATLPPVFVDDGLVIVENFAPYIFRGKYVVAQWEAAYRHHVADCSLENLKVTFGKAHDFSRSGNRVYFVLPTHWQGKCPKDIGPFGESGAWSFVLARISGKWQIMAYTWGVYESTYH